MATPALAELVDEDGRPRFGDPLVEDMMTAAFALGVAWASVSSPVTVTVTVQPERSGHGARRRGNRPPQTKRYRHGSDPQAAGVT